MMTATQVFGERAGRYAAKHSKKINSMPDIKIKKYNYSLNRANRKGRDRGRSLSELKSSIKDRKIKNSEETKKHAHHRFPGTVIGSSGFDHGKAHPVLGSDE